MGPFSLVKSCAWVQATVLNIWVSPGRMQAVCRLDGSTAHHPSSGSITADRWPVWSDMTSDYWFMSHPDHRPMQMQWCTSSRSQSGCRAGRHCSVHYGPAVWCHTVSSYKTLLLIIPVYSYNILSRVMHHVLLKLWQQEASRWEDQEITSQKPHLEATLLINSRFADIFTLKRLILLNHSAHSSFCPGNGFNELWST